MPYAGRHNVQTQQPLLVQIKRLPREIKWTVVRDHSPTTTLVDFEIECGGTWYKDYGIDKSHLRFSPKFPNHPGHIRKLGGFRFQVEMSPLQIGRTIVVMIECLYKAPHGVLQHLGLQKHREFSTREQRLWEAGIAVTGAGPPDGSPFPTSYQHSFNGRELALIRRDIAQWGYEL
ncbi:MAG TPA: hypothetical protein VFF73_27575 [Planctomycetota bacterium]|nr:hypothetical protein [Planctomycetota bacterium]